jgi:hypothetical protein
MHKRIIKTLVSKNYHVAGFYQHCKFFLSDRRGGAPIVVYQMGKVGSSTIVASLKTLKLDKPVYHVHSLTWAGIEHGKQMYARMFRDGSDTNFRRANHLFASQHLCKKIAKGIGNRPWKVISLVRDPVATNVSAFFQIIDHYLPGFTQQYKVGAVQVDDAIRVFLDQYDHEEPLMWFDIELKSTLGVDVYATRFPTSKGYEIYRGAKVDVLILRLEDMNERAGEAFKEFLGIDNFSVVTANLSDEKGYHNAYREFKEAIKLPPSYVANMYESRYVRHFYDDEEIGKFRAKWDRPLAREPELA